ncbi:hypothetical protein AB0D56_37935 [Streptomyces sp. NPDC048209]|uniref:hypothetical protein n=1 Tax=Streptomyces sp. NPDC048209 TaxID=3156689 RepID=UPI00341A36F8
MEIPETRQAEALQKVAVIGAQRAAALAEAERLTEPLRAAVIDAARTGAQRGRIKGLAQVSPSTLYGWLEAAGIEVRTKKTEKERHA